MTEKEFKIGELYCNLNLSKIRHKKFARKPLMLIKILKKSGTCLLLYNNKYFHVWPEHLISYDKINKTK